jgi:hypothetical protein
VNRDVHSDAVLRPWREELLTDKSVLVLPLGRVGKGREALYDFLVLF